MERELPVDLRMVSATMLLGAAAVMTASSLWLQAAAACFCIGFLMIEARSWLLCAMGLCLCLVAPEVASLPEAATPLGELMSAHLHKLMSTGSLSLLACTTRLYLHSQEADLYHWTKTSTPDLEALVEPLVSIVKSSHGDLSTAAVAGLALSLSRLFRDLGSQVLASTESGDLQLWQLCLTSYWSISLALLALHLHMTYRMLTRSSVQKSAQYLQASAILAALITSCIY